MMNGTSFKRNRIAGFASAAVLSILIPVAIDQGYFRYNAYVLPVIGLLLVLLYLFLIVTSSSISAKLHSFHYGIGTSNPLKYLVTVAVAGGVLLFALVGAEWFAINKSLQRIAESRMKDSPLTPDSPKRSQAPVPPNDPDREVASRTSPEAPAKTAKAASSRHISGLSPRTTSSTQQPAPATPPPPTQIISAPNGIAIGGGTVSNPIVNNFAPPMRSLTDAQQSNPLHRFERRVRIGIQTVWQRIGRRAGVGDVRRIL